jgi:hypothetical protein
MKQAVKKIINKVSASLPVVNSTGTNGKDAVPGTISLNFLSSYSSVFIEYYEALLWMNESTSPLEGLMDRLIYQDIA